MTNGRYVANGTDLKTAPATSRWNAPRQIKDGFTDEQKHTMRVRPHFLV